MKKILGISLVALMASSGAFAQMAPKMYAGFGLGYTMDTEVEDSTLDLDNNVNFSLSYGAKITDVLRVEAEYAYYLDAEESINTTNGVDNFINDWKVNNATYMINAYATLPTKGVIKPYAGLGLGYSHKEITYVDRDPLDSGTDVDKDDSFTYQFMLGADFDLPNSPLTLGLEYKYTLGEFTGNNDSDFGIDMQSVAAKLRYAF